MIRSGLPSVCKSGIGFYPWSLHSSQSALTLFQTQTHTYSSRPQVSSGRQPGVCGWKVWLGRVSHSPQVSCTLLLMSSFLEVSLSLARTGLVTANPALYLASPDAWKGGAAMKQEPSGCRTGLAGHAGNQSPLFRNSTASSGHDLAHRETQTPGHGRQLCCCMWQGCMCSPFAPVRLVDLAPPEGPSRGAGCWCSSAA